MRPPLLPRLLVPRLPFFYGWVVLGCICLAGFARQGPAVAVLSVFVVPMTDAFGWSRTEMSGAVSLGGVLAAFIAPLLGPVLDRRGARLILCLAVLGTGFATMALSLTQSLLVFYLLFCFARMVWAGPFDLGLYGALKQLVRSASRACHLDRHAGPDVGARRPADHRPARHARRRLARWLVGDRRDRLARGLPAGLVVAGAAAGGCRPGARPHRRRRKGCSARAALQPGPGDTHARVLAAVALHRPGLSGFRRASACTRRRTSSSAGFSRSSPPR